MQQVEVKVNSDPTEGLQFLIALEQLESLESARADYHLGRKQKLNGDDFQDLARLLMRLYLKDHSDIQNHEPEHIDFITLQGEHNVLIQIRNAPISSIDRSHQKGEPEYFHFFVKEFWRNDYNAALDVQKVRSRQNTQRIELPPADPEIVQQLYSTLYLLGDLPVSYHEYMRELRGDDE